MTRRDAISAVAAGLALLTILVGGRWAASRDVGHLTHGRVVGPAATPTPKPTKRAPRPPQPPAPRTGGIPADVKRTTGGKGVALTFDDGPHPVWTPRVLDQLRKAGVKATFCLIGTEAQRYPALVARIVREGHTLCNHSWHHELNLGSLPEAEIRANLQHTNRAIQQAVPGVAIKYFRQPGGKWTPLEVKIARELGMKSLHWTVDPNDWRKPGSAVIAGRVLDHARQGSIVLLHDGGGDRSDTVGACPAMLASLKSKYTLIPLR